MADWKQEAPRGGAGIEITTVTVTGTEPVKPLVEGLVLKSQARHNAPARQEAPRGGAGIEIISGNFSSWL